MDAAPPDRASELLAQAAWVRRLARGLARDAHQAEDLAQEAWVVALERGGLARGRAWLGGVLRHLALRSRRAAGRRARHEAAGARPEAVAPADLLVARAALHRDLAVAVMELDEPYRTAVLLRYLEGLPPRDIARRLGVPVRTVGARLARGLARLRQDLDERRGGREAWLPAAAALGGGGGALAGGAGAIIMGTKAKAALAAGLVAAALLGVRELAVRGGEPATALGGTTTRAAELLEVAGAPPRAGEDARRAGAVQAQGVAHSSGRFMVRGHVVDAECPELGFAEAPGAARLRLYVSEHDDLLFAGFNPPAVEAHTTARGAFELELADPGYRPVFFKVLCDGSSTHRAASPQGTVERGAAQVEVQVVRRPIGVLHGIVRDPAGTPLAGIRVQAALRPAGRLEAVSDPEGRFMLAPQRGSIDELAVTTPGVGALFLPEPLEREEGGYRDVELVVAPAGRLIVRVVNGERGVAGATVSARLAPEECPLGSISTSRSGPPVFSAETDARGIAELSGVWLGRKLAVGLAVEGGERTYDRVHDGRLAAGDADGEPLIVPAHGTLEVEVSAPRELLVQVTVVFPDGSPVPRPGYEIADTRPAWIGACLKSGTGDDQGRFAVRLLRDELRGELGVLAADGRMRPSLFGGPSFENAARVVLDPDAAQAPADGGAGVLAATLVLQPTHAIAGRVVDERGDPASLTRVWAVPAGSSSPHAPNAFGGESYADTKEGEFRVIGLPEGFYDLYAGRRFAGNGTYGFSTGLVCLRDVPAGTRGAEIAVPAEGGVHVRFTFDAPSGGTAPQEMRVLVGSFVPSDGRAPPPTSPTTLAAGALSSWPLGSSWRFSGGGSETPAGRFWYGYRRVKTFGEHAVRDLGEGWYVLGAMTYTGAVGGELAHFPVATELVYLRPGEHEVRFALTPVAPLRGRLVAEGSVAHLAVALLDEDGRPIPLERPARSEREIGPWLPLSAAGEFFTSVAPLGRHRLRVGTPAELEAGEARLETVIEVKGEPGERFELRL